MARSYARYRPGQYISLAVSLVRELAVRRVGANGWPVALALARYTFADGSLGTQPAARIAEMTGLTEAQVARGMRDLRLRGVIVPALVADNRPDHTAPGHVCRYRFSQDVWAHISDDLCNR